MARPVACPGSGSAPRDLRSDDRRILGRCPSCGRIGTPFLSAAAGEWTMRRHSVRGRNTASHDALLGALYDHATEVSP